MRALLVATLVFVAALAGCSGKKDSGDNALTYTCSDGTVVSEEDYEGVLENITVDFLKTKCPKTGTGTGTKTNTTSLGPNVLPVLMLNITDDGGNVTNVTMLDGNLTFSAEGSFDPDGQVSAIAISVTDSNRTQTKPLYDGAKKAFTDATFNFDRAGIVNVTIAMVDDRAGFNNTVTQVFVNHEQDIDGAQNMHGPPDGIPDNDSFTHPCKGAKGAAGDSNTLIDSTYFNEASFIVFYGASFVEAFPDANTLVTICAPDGTAISDTKSDASPTVSTNAERLPAPAATENYFIGFYAKNAGVTTGARVVVHYEPRPAAAA